MGYIPRKQDREDMANRVAKFAAQRGLTFERRETGDREISITLGSGFYRVLFHLGGNAEAKRLCWLGHWYTDGSREALFPEHFPNLNTITRRRATTFASNAEQFMDSLAIGFEAVAA